MLSGEEQSEYPRSNMDSSTTLMNVYRYIKPIQLSRVDDKKL